MEAEMVWCGATPVDKRSRGRWSWQAGASLRRVGAFAKDKMAVLSWHSIVGQIRIHGPSDRTWVEDISIRRSVTVQITPIFSGFCRSAGSHLRRSCTSRGEHFQSDIS